MMKFKISSLDRQTRFGTLFGESSTKIAVFFCDLSTRNILYYSTTDSCNSQHFPTSVQWNLWFLLRPTQVIFPAVIWWNLRLHSAIVWRKSQLIFRIDSRNPQFFRKQLTKFTIFSKTDWQNSFIVIVRRNLQLLLFWIVCQDPCCFFTTIKRILWFFAPSIDKFCGFFNFSRASVKTLDLLLQLFDEIL